MKFISINGYEEELESLKEDYKNIKKYKNVYLGNKYLFLKNGFSLYYIAYSSLKFAFRRVMVIPLRKKEIHVEYLIIADKRKELAQIKLAGHNIAVEILDALKEKAPNASFVCPERIKK